ncbi:MAG: hypothetical protein NUW00_04830, partial [Candidatus Kaiserbacteria bacterium]|nr:hypothetical protein [Candidatus Kaiserbacteria bacterium]
FTREFDRRLDLLIASKKLNDAKIEVAVRALEAEIGIEIRFATFTSADLLYRVGMNDKLARDVFDYPYIVLIDKIGIRNELARP